MPVPSINLRKPKSIFIGLLVLLCNPVFAADLPVPSPPQISASGYLLVDYDSGQVLAENNADNRLEPASLTKIMTAYLVFKELKSGDIKLDDEVLISEKAWRTPGSRTFVEVDRKVSVELLLKGLIVQSGNDASVALAEYVAGSESTFAELMNSHAQRLGMHDSHFTNSTGLPDAEHYTTPRDIAKVTAASIREYPNLYKWYAIKSFKYNNIDQRNRNLLLWRDESIDGVKTGHTEAAGYCLVASAKKDGMRIISVVMGTDSENARARDSLSLMNYGFRFFETRKLYSAGESLSNTRVWKGSTESLNLGLAEDLFVTLPRGKFKSLQAKMTIAPGLIAPISRGKNCGQVKVALDTEEIAKAPLIALEGVESGSLWHSLVDAVLLWFQ